MKSRNTPTGYYSPMKASQEKIFILDRNLLEKKKNNNNDIIVNQIGLDKTVRQ